MKTTLMLAAGTSGLFALLACASDAAAGADDAAGVWAGTGTTYTTAGASVGNFSVTLTRKGAGAGKIRQDGTVTLASGQVIAFWQEIEDQGSSRFRVVSNNGSGGGRCFANKMCQSYEERPDGHSFATTLVHDDADNLRILVTELDKGQAVRFSEQTLTKKR